jgi:hypothetical protein
VRLKSNFAILDVESGRKRLAAHFAKRPRMGECPEEMRVPVTITGYIDGVHGSDDGTSIEFTVIVDRVETFS